jgi:hypothetical protein
MNGRKAGAPERKAADEVPRGRKPYTKPAFRKEKVFETMYASPIQSEGSSKP